jgi:hypothetical protein
MRLLACSLTARTQAWVPQGRPAVQKPPAGIASAGGRNNCDQAGPACRRAGSGAAGREDLPAAGAAAVTPGPARSPWILRSPRSRFSRASGEPGPGCSAGPPAGRPCRAWAWRPGGGGSCGRNDKEDHLHNMHVSASGCVLDSPIGWQEPGLFGLLSLPVRIVMVPGAVARAQFRGIRRRRGSSRGSGAGSPRARPGRTGVATDRRTRLAHPRRIHRRRRSP